MEKTIEKDQAPATVRLNDPEFLMKNEDLCKQLQAQIFVFNQAIQAIAAGSGLQVKAYITFEFDSGS